MSKETIKLKKYLDVIIERLAAATITPGMLLELTSANKVQAHSRLGEEVTPTLFALEDELQGRGIDDNYAEGDPVQVWVAQRGEDVYAILADDQDVSIGDPLKSAGDGTLIKYVESDSDATGHQNSIVAIALEAVDTQGSPASTTSRIKVMAV